MKNSYLALICGILLFIVLSMAWCRPSVTTPVAGSPAPTVSPQVAPTPGATAIATTPPPASPSAAPTQTGSAELHKAAEKAASAVVELSVFDAAGKLLRNGTGFFISDDGKLVASRDLVSAGVNGIITTADNKIYNVAGILSDAPDLDLAILKADAKDVTFLSLTKAAPSEAGAAVAVVGNPAAKRGPIETKVATRRSEEKEEWLELSSPLGAEQKGLPVITENGGVAGIVATDKSKTPATNNVLAAAVIQAFVAKIDQAATAKWSATPIPAKTPPVKRRIVFNPSPVFPSEARGLKLISASGNYRITFDAAGQAKNVEILRSTGAPVLDRAVITALQQWKSEPGGEWTVVVPVSFQPKAN